MYTEEEAKKLWCPEVRYLAVFVNKHQERECTGAYNRGAVDSGLHASNCRASQCAMWRWTGGGKMINNKKELVGYCGLGGKP